MVNSDKSCFDNENSMSFCFEKYYDITIHMLMSFADWVVKLVNVGLWGKYKRQNNSLTQMIIYIEGGIVDQNTS